MNRELVVFIACFIGFFVLLVGVVNALSRAQCANNVTEMGRKYRYDFVNGCRIQLKDGTFIHWKMFREFDIDY